MKGVHKALNRTAEKTENESKKNKKKPFHMGDIEDETIDKVTVTNS